MRRSARSCTRNSPVGPVPAPLRAHALHLCDLCVRPPVPSFTRVVQIDNSSRPYIPKLRWKPNAITPLELRLEQHAEAMTNGPAQAQPAAWYANPYAPEIMAFSPTEVCTPAAAGVPSDAAVASPARLRPLLVHTALVHTALVHTALVRRELTLAAAVCLHRPHRTSCLPVTSACTRL